MSKFYKLKVADITRETADCVSVSFSIPESLKSEYSYNQGQYITIKLNVQGEEIRRSYSLCSSPFENEFRVAIKKVKDGRGSTFINEQLKPATELDVMTPMGNFYTPLNPANKKNYILFAGGSGITPMMSIIKTVLASEPGSKVILLYGNQDEASVIFKKQLDELASRNGDRFKIAYVHNVPPAGHPSFQTGIMDKAKNQLLINNFVDLNADNEFFICGPLGMMDAAKAALEELKVDKNRIHIEYFTAPVEAKSIADNNEPAYIRSEVTIICDGDEKTIIMEPGDIVLDAAINAGFDAPFACRGGSCCTCRAKLIEGKVVMDVNFALLDSEVAEGYILTCQSHPITDKVVVDYDKGR